MALTKEQNEALKIIDSQNAIAGIMDTVRSERAMARRPFSKMPEKVRYIEHVRLPAEGGMQTQFEGVKYPMNGFPVSDAVDRIDVVKSVTLSVLSGFNQMFGENRLKTILLLVFFRKEITASFNATVMSMAKTLGDYSIQPRYYAPAVKEIHDAILAVSENLEGYQKNIVAKIGRIVCTVLQYDDSYRYRIQHVVGQISRREYRFDPMGELLRVVDIGIHCENDERIKKTWKAGRLFLKIVKYVPAFRQYVISVFRRINPDRVQLSVGDYYYAREKTEYDWLPGLSSSIIEEAKSWEKI